MKKHYQLFFLFLFSAFISYSAPALSDSLIIRLMRMNLYDMNSNGQLYRLDGTFAQYGDNYSNDIDGEDGRKMINPGVNVCLLRNHINLVVERRHTITADDTLFFNIWGLQRKTYLMKFVGSNLEEEGLQAYLEDSYLHTSMPVNLNDTTNIPLQITGDPGSSMINRFRLVFRIQQAPVIHFTAIDGQQILLNWSGRNADSVRKYWIQRSSNGTDFTDVGTLTNPVSLSGNFKWADPFPTAGFNYYRIKSLLNNGEVLFSNQVVTKMPLMQDDIVIFPNPARADNINLKMEKQPAGKYSVRLLNSFGQSVMQTSFDFTGGSGIQKIQGNRSISPGVYHLLIIKPDGKKQVLELVF